MKSQTRAWILAALVTLLWSTPFVAPFRYFAEMLVQIAAGLASQLKFSAPVEAVSVLVLLTAVLACLFWLDRSRNRVYLAAYIALAEVAYHMWVSFKSDQAYDIPLPISIGLSLALLFMLIPRKSPGTWLSDAYTMAIPAWIIAEAALAGFFKVFGWSSDLLDPLLIVPEKSIIFNLENWLQLPLLVWSVLAVALAALPILLLAKGRTKG